MATSQRQPSERSRSRVARHRSGLAAAGLRRVEVTVPSEDAVLVREIAAALRAGGESAERVRDSVEPLLKRKRATTGRELVDFFLNSPLAGSGIEVERDKSPGRDIDL